MAENDSESPPVYTAADLIAHLENGGLIATGDPRHVTFLRFEIWESGGNIAKHLGVYGWGSAIGSPEGRLKNVLEEPYKWVKVIAAGTNEEQEATAAIELHKIGRYDEEQAGRWVFTTREIRQPNIS